MRPTRLFRLLALVLLCLAPALRADLVWSPETGWRVEGGVLANTMGQEARNALEVMNKAREAEEKGQTGRALRYYRRVTNNYPKSIYAPEAYYRTAILRVEQRRFAKAFTAYQQITMGYPNYDKFSNVIADQYRIASAVASGARGRWMWGLLPGFTHRESAIYQFEQIVANAPYSDYAPLALMNVAALHQRLRQHDEAINALDRVINFYPNSILTPRAYLQLGQTFASLVDGPEYDQAATKEAITFFGDFLILYPGDAGVAEAEAGLAKMKTVLALSKMRIAEFYDRKRSNYTAAKVLYNEAITIYPDSEVAKKARARLEVVEDRLAKAAQQKAAAAAGKPAESKSRRKILWIF